MKRILMVYVATLLPMVALDFCWLSLMSSRLYQPELHDLLLDNPLMGPAALFYLVYIVGVVIFAVAPALQAKSHQKATLSGALFGFFTYATYDLTNLATLRGWSVTVTLADVAWGTVLTGIAATVGYGVTVKVMAGKRI